MGAGGCPRVRARPWARTASGVGTTTSSRVRARPGVRASSRVGTDSGDCLFCGDVTRGEKLSCGGGD